MFTLDEIKNIRKTYMYYYDTKELKLQMRVRNDSTVTKPEDLSQEEKNKIIAALYVSRSIRDAMSHYFNRGKSEQELLDEIQLGFDKQLLEPGEKSIRPMILITGRIADSMLVDLASPKENTNHMPEVYLQHLLSENGKKATNIRREIRGGQEYSISYDVEPLSKSKNPFVASLNPNNSQYTQPTTEIQLSSDVTAKKRAFVDRLIAYYDMMENDEWYEKRLANEDRNMQDELRQEKTALLKYTYEQVLATQAEQVASKSNNIDNIPEIGKLIIKEGMKNNGLYIQLNAG